MRLLSSLPGVLVLLSAVSLTFSLPTLDSISSRIWRRPTALVSRRPQSKPSFTDVSAHLNKRRAEIYELEKRQMINCTDPNALFFEDCWDILKIHDYLVAPVTGWINTVRYCENEGNSWENDGASCCVKGEPWSTCYLRLACPGSAFDCTSPSGGRCTDAMISAIRVDPSIHPYARYTVKNIYCRSCQNLMLTLGVVMLTSSTAINNFFYTYYQALYNAAGVVSNNVEKMIQVVDVLVQPSLKLQNILLAFAVGLAFLGAPSFAIQMLSIEGHLLKGAAQALVISTQQAPNVGRALWPAGTDRSQEIQTAELHVQLSNITHQMSDMMDGGVRLLMNDIATFVNYADNKRYSGPNVTNTGEGTGLTVPAGTDAVAYALKTYLLSYAMGQNKWWASFQLGPYTQEQAGTAACWATQDISNCVNRAGEGGNVQYWSPYSQRIYTLQVQGPKEALKPSEMMSYINTYGWAPFSVLFDGAYNCTAEGRAGSASVNFNFDGTLDLACLSQLPLYIDCGGFCPVALVNNTCPFGDIGTIIDGACKSWNGWT
ncbi:MAG: hypothetical protein Q9170_003650 [Blastenia crenularia]